MRGEEKRGKGEGKRRGVVEQREEKTSREERRGGVE